MPQKCLKKGAQVIAAGTKRNHGRTLHVVLSHKCQTLRNHAHYSVINSGGDSSKMRRTLLNCVNHFRGKHGNWDEEWQWKEGNHVPSTHLVKCPGEIGIPRVLVMWAAIYKSGEGFAPSKDSIYVEYFNNTVLIHLDKRLQYQDTSYQLLQSLPLLDWNEHVGRDHSSIYRIQECRHINQQNVKKEML